MKNSLVKSALLRVFILIIAIAAVAALPLCLRAKAEDAPVVALSPVEANADAAYYYFDRPQSVFADAAGLVISDGNAVKAAVGTEITKLADVAADKTLRRGDRLITLENGGVYMRYCGDDETAASDDKLQTDLVVTDFDVDGTTLYAVAEDKLITAELGETSFVGTPVIATLVSTEHARVNATAVALSHNSDGLICYVAVDSEMFSAGKQDICTVAPDGALAIVLQQTDRVSALSVMDYSETLYTLAPAGIKGYAYTGGGLKEKFRAATDSPMLCFCAFDGFVYAFDSGYALHKLAGDLSSDVTLLASASSADGFFYMPTGGAVKNSALYVSDAVNGRVAIYGDKLEYLNGLTNPVSVAADCFGAVYVAYDYNKVGIFSDGSERTVAVDGLIKQIAVDADGKLYILADDGLWLSENGKTAQRLLDARFKSITLSVGREKLYALGDGAVYLIDPNADGGVKADKFRDAPKDAFSLAVDISDNVFTLSRTHITRISDATTTYALTANDAPYSLGFTRGQILLSTVSNRYADYGDVIVIDAYKHRVFTAGGAPLGVTLVDDDYNDSHLDVKGDAPTKADGTRIIRKALRDAEIFDRPMGSPLGYTIAKGRNVIVPLYTLDDAREYALVMIDNLTTGELVTGYVYKGALSEPLPYAAPPAKVCTVYSNATPVYKWPSRGAKKLSGGFSAVERNTVFDMLDFVDAYRDDYDNLWYRVSINEAYEGYILAANLSLNGYEPNFIRPAYNAEIISYNGSEVAQTYAKDENGDYTPLAAVLPTGTKVEVVGTFDTSLPYTQIKYLDPDFGTLTCYVQTVYIDYGGVNVVLIVAVVVIIVTVILAALIIWRQVAAKNKMQSEEKEVF